MPVVRRRSSRSAAKPRYAKRAKSARRSGAPLMSGRGQYRPRRLSGRMSGRGAYIGGLPELAELFAGPTVGLPKPDYSSNSLIGGGNSQVPSFHSMNDGTIVYSHREYLSDLTAPLSGSFSPVTYELNPGILTTFPWLSQIAANFEEYTLKQCIVTFKSTVAEFASTSGQVGQVIIATQYNNEQPDFLDKRSMMEYEGAQSAKTSALLLHGVECSPKMNSGSQGKYIRVGPLANEGDINSYDAGKTTIACVDVPSTYYGQVLGEIWISYTVELRKPKQWTSKGNSELIDSVVCFRGQPQLISRVTVPPSVSYDSMFNPYPGDTPVVNASKATLKGKFYPTGGVQYAAGPGGAILGFKYTSDQLGTMTPAPPLGTPGAAIHKGYGAYVFNPACEGIFRIKLKAIVPGIAGTDPAGDNLVAAPTLGLFGSVVKFNDIIDRSNLNWITLPNQVGTVGLSTWTTGAGLVTRLVPLLGGNDYQFNMEWHVKVTRPVNGGINAVYFNQFYDQLLPQVPGLNGPPVIAPWAGAWDTAVFTVEQYNSNLSFAQSGKNDAIAYQDSNGISRSIVI